MKGLVFCAVNFIRFFFFSDEIDIMGYGSATSDTDDHSSVESSLSDGFTIAVKRVRLNSSYSESLWENANGTSSALKAGSYVSVWVSDTL